MLRGVGFKQVVIGVPPDARPNDRKAVLVQQCWYHGNIYAVEVNFPVPQASPVFAPVVPKVTNDFCGNGLRGFGHEFWRRVVGRSEG